PPNDRASERLDTKHNPAVLKDADRAGRLTDGHGNRIGLLADGRGGPVPAAEPHAEGDSLGQDVEVHASRHGHGVAPDDNGPFELGDILDLLTDFAIANVPLGLTVAAERVEVDGPSHAHDLAGIADHEHGPDRLAFPALAADGRGQVHHGP